MIAGEGEEVEVSGIEEQLNGEKSEEEVASQQESQQPEAKNPGR